MQQAIAFTRGKGQGAWSMEKDKSQDKNDGPGRREGKMQE